MADMDFKLEQICPLCGTGNPTAARRCSQCLQELAERHEPSADSVAALFERGPAVGFNARFGASDPFAEASLPTPENPAPLSPLRPNRPRRRPALVSSTAVSRLVFFARLSSVLFLLWGVLDTSAWLTRVTAGLAANDIAAVRYSVFAVYEVLRDVALVIGVWLLTLLRPKPTP